ncbi:hypothetical protein FE257_010941 [Aspergillus nanangensis]|uniref:Arabinan endo-1,5-alpha-L-arabinosidase n=1 Tax=Aspergillus nanangensis TaxID=2582783 RepID=A0AAD4CVS7_ASPNN|nr:hypothetical protein FE257_010941 [Aspergillus nanangensis]
MLHLVCFALIALANAFANPGPCIGDCWTHDPGLYQRKSDGRYFRFATGGGVRLSSAPTITGPWKAVGDVLPGGSKIDHVGSDNLWAPDVHYQDNTKKYYMYYSVSELGKKNSVIGVASSDTMAPGSWTDHGSIGLDTANNPPYNTIDANWIRIDGTPYLNWGSFWQNLFQARMENPLKISGDAPRQIAFNGTLNHRIEAAFEFQHGNYYYLTFSSGIGGNYDVTLPAQGMEYSIRVCRSEGGKGNFVDKAGRSCLESGGTTLLASHGNVYAPGGQGIVQDKILGLVLYYHYADKNKGLAKSQYQFGWNRLNWVDGWPTV